MPQPVTWLFILGVDLVMLICSDWWVVRNVALGSLVVLLVSAVAGWMEEP